jgi:hypothetical protein
MQNSKQLGWGYSSVVEHFPNVHKTLGSFPNTRKYTYKTQNNCKWELLLLPLFHKQEKGDLKWLSAIVNSASNGKKVRSNESAGYCIWLLTYTEQQVSVTFPELLIQVDLSSE